MPCSCRASSVVNDSLTRDDAASVRVCARPVQLPVGLTLTFVLPGGGDVVVARRVRRSSAPPQRVAQGLGVSGPPKTEVVQALGGSGPPPKEVAQALGGSRPPPPAVAVDLDVHPPRRARCGCGSRELHEMTRPPLHSVLAFSRHDAVLYHHDVSDLHKSTYFLHSHSYISLFCFCGQT